MALLQILMRQATRGSLGLLLLASACGGSACSLSNGPDDSVETGGGPLVHRAFTLTWLDEAGTLLAASRLGLRSVELLQLDPEPALIATVRRDDCDSFPLAVTGVDVDLDGASEVAVSDAECGNWFGVREGSAWQTEQWPPSLPATSPAADLASVATQSGDQYLLVGSPRMLDLVSRPAGAAMWTHDVATTESRLDFMRATPAASLTRDAETPWLVHQLGDVVAVYQPCATCEDPLGTPRLYHPEPDAPFRGFDHLALVPTAAEWTAFGLAVFPPDAGPIPRRVYRIWPTSDEAFAYSVLIDAPALTFAAWDWGGEVAIAAMDDSGFLSIGLVEGGEYSEVDSTATGWTMQALPAPSGVQFPGADGAMMLVGVHGGSVDIVMYDGYSVLRASLDSELAITRVERTSISEERLDVVW